MEGEGKHSEGKSRRGREKGDVMGGGAAFLSKLPTNRVFAKRYLDVLLQRTGPPR